MSEKYAVKEKEEASVCTAEGEEESYEKKPILSVSSNEEIKYIVYSSSTEEVNQNEKLEAIE